MIQLIIHKKRKENHMASLHKLDCISHMQEEKRQVLYRSPTEQHKCYK